MIQGGTRVRACLLQVAFAAYSRISLYEFGTVFMRSPLSMQIAADTDEDTSDMSAQFLSEIW